MPRHRLPRFVTTLLVALSLLFAQLALASYVCPGQSDAESMAEMMATGEPCDGMDEQQPGLCHEHATDAGKTFEAFKLPTPALPLIVQMVQLPLAFEAMAAFASEAAAMPQPRPPPDPLFLATLRLRV